MILNRRRFSFLAMTFMEHGTIKVLDAVITLLLIRSLSVNSLGIFTIYQSWVGILLVLFPALENAYYREYGHFRKINALGRELAVFKAFNAIKMALALALILLCSLYPIATGVSWFSRVAILALAFTLPLSQAFYGIFRETLRFELKQTAIVTITILQKVLFIAAIYFAGAASDGNIAIISPLIVGVAVLIGFIWQQTLHRSVTDIPKISVPIAQALPRIRTLLTDAILWIHINGALTGAIQTLDIYFLSRSRASLSEIALYSIALKAANFLQILCIPVAQTLGVYLARKPIAENSKQASKFVWGSMLLFLAAGVGMLIVGQFIAEPLLAFLGKGKFSNEELSRGVSYFHWQLAGIVILVTCYGHGIYLNHKANLKFVTAFLFVPWAILSALIYHWSAEQGVLVTAQYNVLVYSLCTLGHVALFFYSKSRNKNAA